MSKMKGDNVMWECYLDGLCVRKFANESDAWRWCDMYDGDKQATYDFVEEN